MSGSLDREVVVDEVELGLPALGEHHLVGAGDGHDPSGHLDVHPRHGIAAAGSGYAPAHDEGETDGRVPRAKRSKPPGPSTSSAACSEHDWPAWADMFTDDARYEEHNLGVFEGKPAITQLHRRHHEGVPGDDPLDRVVDHRRRPHRLLHLEQPARPDRHREALRRSPTPPSSQYGGDGKFSFEADYYNPADAERVFKEWLTDGGRRDTPQDRSLRGIDGWNPEPPRPAFPREEVEAEFEKYRQRAALAVETGDWDQWADQFTDDAHYREHHYGYFTLRQPRSGPGSSR